MLKVDRAAARPRTLPIIAFFPMADYVLPVLPNQLLLIGLSLLRPANRFLYAAIFAGATGLGAGLVALAIQTLGAELVSSVFGGLAEGDRLARVRDLVRQYGLLALVGVARLPPTPRTAVIICALANLSLWLIGGAVALGKSVPCLTLALIGANSPRLLNRWPAFRRLVAELETQRAPAATAGLAGSTASADLPLR